MVSRRNEAIEGFTPGPIGQWMEFHYNGYNAATTVEAAQAWVRLIKEQDGQMFVTLAGAMSTAQLGRSLAPVIRDGQICGIGCTGANLEEDLFNLVGFNSYTYLPHYANLSPEEEKALAESGHPRVTDQTIPEAEAMKPVGDALADEWRAIDQIMTQEAQRAAASTVEPGEIESRIQDALEPLRVFPHDVLYRIIRSGVLASRYEADPLNSWVVAAAEMNIPIFVPGWEDSTTGNQYAGFRKRGEIKHKVVKDGTEWFEAMGDWYTKTSRNTPIGYFQIGGGIAGDGPICVVPYLLTEMKKKRTPFWSYFCQITDAHVSYGGYSGAQPREKITWSKLDVDTPMFDIHSCATVVAPLIFDYVLGN